jgi:hypothetical protein
MTETVKTIVEKALGGSQRVRVLWTANYYPALPIVPQAFEIGALLPAMLYMARFGHRRGRGRFVETFGKQRDGTTTPPTIATVADGLRLRLESSLEGFDDGLGGTVLGDLLLAWCLENRKHAEGHSEQVQRIYPTHYLASWVDLPAKVADLRGVPEILTALLAHQDTGEWVEPRGRGRFPVGVPHGDNHLLALFARQMQIRGAHGSNLGTDTFNEADAVGVGIDELLAIRMAQVCGVAPDRARGRDETERISNRHPLALRAAECLREDLAVFIEVYGGPIPRQAFLQTLESGIALGLANLLLSTVRVLGEWERTGTVPDPAQQSPWPLFVDASQGQDRVLRDLSEASMAEAIRCFERLPFQMMLLRVLDDRVSTHRRLREQLPPKAPDPVAFTNLLGDVYQGRHPRTDVILDAFHEDCQRLAEGLETEGEALDVAERLRSGGENPAMCLAEALCDLMGDKLQRGNFMRVLESALMTDQPNGLALKRRITREQRGTRRSTDLRSLVLNPPLLDFLVHRHLRKAAKGKPFHPLSLPDFLARLRERYGLFVDREPPGQPIPQELLLRNKACLERRLRDLGLLIGVNDAESMKQLRPRYATESDHAV